MPIYIAMLRGINVSGQKLIKMEKLRSSCQSLRFENVQTYVQSGNIIFSCKEAASGMSQKIEKMIQKDFGFEVPVVVRTPAELKSVIKKNPFLKKKEVEGAKLYVTFLSQVPDKEALMKLKAVNEEKDQFQLIGKEIYLFLPDGYGKTKLSNNLFERILKIKATTRNWNTVNTLLEMAEN